LEVIDGIPINSTVFVNSSVEFGANFYGEEEALGAEF
jgi:hypothetical protein